jgi:hypothetical protein
MSTEAIKGKKALQYAAACLGRYTEADGAEYLIDWAGARQSFSVEVFSSVCNEFAERRKNDPRARKPTIRDLISSYEKRMSNKRQNEAVARDHCGKCYNTGWRHTVLGGESPGNARVVDPRRVVPLCYACANLIPCFCTRGQRSKLNEKYNPETVKRMQSDFTFDTGQQASTFALACRLEWEKETGYIRKGAMPTGVSPEVSA